MQPRLTANGLLMVLLACWWLLNVVQATFTELANDESYYWFFAWHLDWGYYDHPPMTPLLIWLGSWLPGELGVRLCVTLLQPLYLYLLWMMIRPSDATRRDAWLYFLVAFSIPLMQLYGFVATPDAPLMMFSVLFLFCFQRFCDKDNLPHALLLGVSIALLAYSKYHGALVVLLTLAAYPRCFKSPRLYLAGIVFAVLYLPHLLWQYHHDWASFQYHLMGRNSSFRMEYASNFVLNAILVFNPLFVYHYIKGWNHDDRHCPEPLRRAMLFIVAGFLGFFLLSSMRGPTQPQWIIPATIGLIWILFDYARQHERSRRYVRTVGLVCVALFLAARLLVMWNPFHWAGELWDNRESNRQIAAMANGRPVIFPNDYTAATKYIFYTGGGRLTPAACARQLDDRALQPKSCGEAFAQPLLYTRTSQWEYTRYDDLFAGRDIIVQRLPSMESKEDFSRDPTMTLANGRTFYYREVPAFRPLRRIGIRLSEPLDSITSAADSIRLSLVVTNPYPYPIVSTAERPVWIQFYMEQTPNDFRSSYHYLDTVIPAHDSLRLRYTFAVPQGLDYRRYTTQIAIRDSLLLPWRNSEVFKVNYVK